VQKLISSLRNLQSGVILPTARTLYVVAACISLFAAGLAILFAVYFQATSVQFSDQKPLPPPYQAGPTTISFGPIDQRLAPPSNIRFVVDLDVIDRPLGDYDVLGHFDADTPNGLGTYPDDFDIIGGKDADFFSRAPWPARNGRTGLRAAPALAAEINTIVGAASTLQQRSFELRVVAHDSLGRLSKPANVAFSLAIGPRPAAAGKTTEAPRALNDLESLAREIALVIDPERTPTYFDAYKRALATPRQCGVGDAPDFVGNYAKAFQHARPQLNASTIEAFYSGVCDAWSEAVRQQEEAAAAAEQARAAIETKNLMARAAAETKAIAARAFRNIAIGVLGGALTAFLTIALLLALMAIEGHSKAMREAIDILANQGRRS
jgi:hypothetical protein